MGARQTMKILLTILILLIVTAKIPALTYSEKTITISINEINKISLSNKYNKYNKIYINNGEYYDEVYITSNMEIIGLNNPTLYGPLIIEGANIYISNILINIIPRGTAIPIIIIKSNNVTLENINISGGPIIIINSNNIKINNITISETKSIGIRITNSTSINLYNIIHNYKYDNKIFICNSLDIKIIKNNINVNEIVLCESQDPGEIFFQLEITEADDTEPITVTSDYGDDTIINQNNDDKYYKIDNNNLDNNNNDAGGRGLSWAIALIPILLILGAAVAYKRKGVK